MRCFHLNSDVLWLYICYPWCTVIALNLHCVHTDFSTFPFQMSWNCLQNAVPTFCKESKNIRDSKLKTNVEKIQRYLNNLKFQNVGFFNLVLLHLQKEFRDHFLNITRIMDCVGCDKCKLWGKLQVRQMFVIIILEL